MSSSVWQSLSHFIYTVCRYLKEMRLSWSPRAWEGVIWIWCWQGPIQDFALGARSSAEWDGIWRGVSTFLLGELGPVPCPSPEILKCLKSLGHELRILVHSRALLSAKLHCRLIRPVLEYACPVCHSCLTVAQSKALEFLQKRTLNAIFPGSEYATNLSIAHVETESRRHISHSISKRHSSEIVRCLLCLSVTREMFTCVGW